MTTPPPVYESPRWLPPPIASTEGRRRLVSQTLGRRSGMRGPIFGARASEDSDSATERGHASGGLGFGSSRHAFVGPRTRTRRRSTLDPALTAQRRHCAHPGGRDEHRQTKMAP
jgi:hypothetical protein